MSCKQNIEILNKHSILRSLNALTESTLMSLLSLTLVKVGGEEILTKGPMFLQQELKSPVFGLVQMGLPQVPMVKSHLLKKINIKWI